MAETKEKEYLDYLNNKYKFPRSLIHNSIKKQIDKCLKIVPRGGKFLDAGCGNGSDVYRYASLFEIFGIDYQEEYINYCKNKYSKGNFSVQNIYKLDFEDEFFDGIVMNQVIEHLAYPQRVIEELYRVLKKNGVLIIGTPNYESIAWIAIESIWYKLLKKEFDIDTHKFKFTESKLIEITNIFEKIEISKIFLRSILIGSFKK